MLPHLTFLDTKKNRFLWPVFERRFVGHEALLLRAILSFFVDLIMGAKLYELDRFVAAIWTIMTTNNLVIPFSPANQAIEVNDDKIFLHWSAVIPTEICLQRFADCNRIRKNHVHFLPDWVLQRRMFFSDLAKSSLNKATIRKPHLKRTISFLRIEFSPWSPWGYLWIRDRRGKFS